MHFQILFNNIENKKNIKMIQNFGLSSRSYRHFIEKIIKSPFQISQYFS